MARNVIILASGETERRALPHLLAHLEDRGVSVVEVRIPPRNGALSVRMAERLIKAAWYERLDASPENSSFSWMWMEEFPIVCWSLSERFPNVWAMRLGQRFCTPVHSGISKPGTLPMR